MIKFDPLIRLPSRKKMAPFKMVFVMGCPRSGTTVAGECLGAADGCTSIGESLFVRYPWRIITDLVCGENVSAISPLRSMPYQDLVSALGDLCDSIYSSLNKKSAGVIVDHTPWNAAHLPLLHALYPDACFVHVVRHPVAVSESLMKSYLSGRRWATNKISYHARLWATLNQCVELAPSQIRPHVMTYEQLCREPLETISGVLNHCGLESNPNVLKQLAISHASSGGKGDGVRLAKIQNEEVVIQPIEREVEWSRSISPKELRIFNKTVFPLADKYGYSI